MRNTRAALYLRISQAADDDMSAIDRQREDCLALAESVGVEVVAEYVDHDRSAYSAKPRPGFENLLRAARAGEIDTILVWATDRLYRRLTDLERIVSTLDGVDVLAVKSGRVDLSTADGRLHARMLGSVAQHESEKKAERLTARAKQRAHDGVMVASARPFGWTWADPDPVDPTRPRKGSRAGLVIDEHEAEAVREVFSLVAGGGSVRGAARLLTERGFTGTNGVPFGPDTARLILTNPRHAGRVLYRGKVLPGVEGAARIVDCDTFDRVDLILSDPSRRTSPGRPAGTPLSGIARCGKCGGPMNASNKHSRGTKAAVYVCAREQHLTRRRELVDGPVLALMGAWLIENAERIAASAEPPSSDREREARARAEELTVRLDRMTVMVAEGLMDPVDFAPAAKAIRARLADARKAAARVRTRPATAALVGAESVSEAWAALVADEDVEPLRRLLREVLDSVQVLPAAKRHHPSVDDLAVVWAAWLTE